jgi:hypothetical protein
MLPELELPAHGPFEKGVDHTELPHSAARQP